MNTQPLIDLIGQALTVTGADRGQCTAVAHWWEKYLGLPIVYGDAVNTYGNAPAAQYERVANSPTGVPPAGAIVVWQQNAKIGTGAVGHTAVSLGGDTRTFESIDQNWPTGSPVKRVRHTYDGVVGWFIPRVVNNQGGTTVNATPEQVDLAFKAGFNRAPNADEMKWGTSNSVTFLLQTVFNNNIDFRTKAANFDKFADALTVANNRIAELTAAAANDSRVTNLKAALLEVLK